MEKSKLVTDVRRLRSISTVTLEAPLSQQSYAATYLAGCAKATAMDAAVAMPTAMSLLYVSCLQTMAAVELERSLALFALDVQPRTA